RETSPGWKHPGLFLFGARAARFVESIFRQRHAEIAMRATKSTKPKAAKKPASAHAASRLLEGVGVTQAEEQLYRTLLRCEGLCIAELATKLASSARAIASPLRALEGKGMVTHSPDRVPRYYAVPPDIAIEALIAKSQLDEEL